MSHLRQTVLIIALATASIGSWAQTDAQHAQHHPNTATAEQSSTKESASETKSASVEKMASMDNKMKAMHEMHEKMMNAKTPEERNALMAQHMKTMQAGMAAMSMKGQKPMPGNMKMRQQMMEKRMDMMETMMQMMMDGMPPPAAK
jgi:flagellar biosynthesis GTPase FlhF